MKKNVDDIYKNIARNMFTNMEKGWATAFIEIEREKDGQMELSGGYTSNDDTFTAFDFARFDQRIHKDFNELYDITVSQGHYGWTQAKFNLDSNGKFSLDFATDPVFEEA